MKSILPFALFALLFASSCKKDWTCRCTYTTSGGSYDITAPIFDLTKSKAKSVCDDLGSHNANPNAVDCHLEE